MNWKDVQLGSVVYHRIYAHWGKGVVDDVVPANAFETLFERGSRRRAIVSFEGNEKPVRLKATEIRRTPNRKKILEMVKLYESRGEQAIDGGDILIIPLASQGTTQVNKNGDQHA